MRTREDPHDTSPCRRPCKHYDCLMDRGEPLPEGVTGYRHGVLYVPGAPGAAPDFTTPMTATLSKTSPTTLQEPDDRLSKTK